MEVAAKIRKFLTDDHLKNDLKLISKDQQKFQYEEVDLNSDGTIITIFSISEAPFIALKSKTNGWRELLAHSNRPLRSLKYDGKPFPENPSVAPKFNHTPSDDAYRLLWDEFSIPTFKF